MQQESPDSLYSSVRSHSLSANNCLTEETAEDYLRGRLNAADAEQVEGHLLFCAACQDLMGEQQEIYETLRCVARKAEAQRIESETQSRTMSGRPWWQSVFPAHRTRWALAAGTAALALAFLVMLPRTTTNPVYSEVLLVETRSTQAALSAPAGQPLALKADLRGLDPAASFLFQAVDANGSIVESQKLQASGPEVLWHVRAGLPPGQYWIRVSAAANPAAVLREYSLSLR